MISCKILIALFTLTRFHHNKSTCLPEGISCNEDCECCGFDHHPPSKCQIRNHALGRRCYQSGGSGAVCDEDVDCRSQTCIDGFCVPKAVRPPAQKKCLFSEEEISNVIGTRVENICDCLDVPPNPTTEDALLLFDETLTTVYSNNYAINGGVEFKPVEKGSLRLIEICTGPDKPESDPTCYKLEGFCADSEEYRLIQEGALDLPLLRNKCIEIPIVGLPLYSKYKLTFPCQRGTCRDSCGNFCRAGPRYAPDELQCIGYVDDGTNNVGTLDYISHSYDPVLKITTFLYSMLNLEVNYMVLSWLGDCSMAHYYVYEDLNGNKIIDTNEVCCFRKCGVDFLWPDENTLEVCMAGLELWSSTFTNPGLFIIQILVAGEVIDVEYKQYAAYGLSGTIEYSQVPSPVCPQTLCEATCPLRLAEVNFLTNCNEFLAVT